MKCARSRCTRTAARQGHCALHYLHIPRGYCDSEPVRAHMERLLCRYSKPALIEASGLSHATIDNIRTNRHQQVQRSVYDAIMRIPIPTRPISGTGVVPAVGTARRIKGLARMGWPGYRIADHCRTRESEIWAIHKQPIVMAWRASDIADLYSELHMTPGPSKRSAQRALSKGWEAPLDWEPETIDDPDARPVKPDRPPFSELYAYLRGLGLTDEQIATELGVDLESLQRRRQRHMQKAAS